RFSRDWSSDVCSSDLDARGQLASGVEVNGPADLAQAILARPEMFVQAFTERLMTYALGRPLRAQDMPAVRRIVRTAAPGQYRLRSEERREGKRVMFWV